MHYFKLSPFDLVINRKMIRDSIVGTQLDLMECLAFAAEGKVKVHYTLEHLNNINCIINKMIAGQTQGRIVMQIQE